MRRMLLAFLLLALVAAPTAGAWSWPVGGAVLRTFSLGDDPYAGGQHRGIDVAAAVEEWRRARPSARPAPAERPCTPCRTSTSACARRPTRTGTSTPWAFSRRVL